MGEIIGLYILVITLSNKGGSWYSTKLLLDEIRRKSRLNIVICSGRPSYRMSDRNIKHVHIDIVDVYMMHSLFINAPLISLFLFMPISICALFLSIIYRPRMIVVNGIVPLFMLIPLRIFRRSILIVLEYHGAMEGYIPKLLMKMLKAILNNVVDIAIVNSVGSYKDLSLIIDNTKIIVQEHVVDDEFFTEIDRRKQRYDINIDENKFVIAYIGHLTFEKGFDVFLRVLMRLVNRKDIGFIIVGDGPLRRYVELLEEKFDNVRYLGYVPERSLLHKYYTIADLVWSYADETYLARPAVEALASGTPIIVPDVPAVLSKRRKGKRIPKTLIPRNVGFIVDHTNIDEIVRLILELMRKRNLLEYMGKKSREYARKKYSRQRLEAIADFIVRKADLL